MTGKIAREKQIVLVLVGVLTVTVLFGPGKQLRLFTHRAPAPVSAPRPEARPVPAGEQRAQEMMGMESEDLAAMSYTAHQLRDPLESLLPTSSTGAANQLTLGSPADPATAPHQRVPPPALQLQGVVWGGPVPRAIINHRVYGVGDVVEGALVKAIERQQVVLEFQGEAITLTNAPEVRSRKPSMRIGRQPEGGG